uniref:Uncharacterized protein n=1 Tax=uncultured prokaryote TaxID=198431 RepID=A0A0H5PZ54_9ZZZZ|nr:hypothetical protein [uncultured prokaryote]
MHEILTRWTGGYSATEMVSVMYFKDLAPIEECREFLADFWTDVATVLHSGYTWTIDTEGRSISPTSGKTTGIWQHPLAYTGNGGVGVGGPVSNASMVLFQWRTGTYQNGREVRGRTFVPGLSNEETVGGELDSAARSQLVLAARTHLVTPGVLQIWSRPRGTTPGSVHEVTNAGVWNELAVLRGRRG